MKILFLEDDLRLQRQIVGLLKGDGYEVDAYRDGADALRALQTRPYLLAILDISVPTLSGFEIARNLRQKGNQLPIIFLTAEMGVRSLVQGLTEYGGNDYIKKTAEPEEFLARVNAQTNRLKGATSHLLTNGPITVNTRSKQVLLNEQDLELTHSEYELFECFALKAGELIARNTLSALLRNEGQDADNLLDKYISVIRKKLTLNGREGKETIVTVKGAGYRYEIIFTGQG